MTTELTMYRHRVNVRHASPDYGWTVTAGCSTCGGDIEVSSRTGNYVHSTPHDHLVTRPVTA